MKHTNMISITPDGSRTVTSSLVNVGQKVEEALKKKNELYTAVYEVNNSLLTTSRLFKISGCLDRGEYVEAMKHVHPDHRIYCNYVLRTTRALTAPVNHKTMFALVYPRGSMVFCPTVNEMLSFVCCHKAKVKTLLSRGHRLIFVGDIGRTPVTHVGIVTMSKRRICFDRELVTDRTEYLPSDLFLTRYIL